jgi:D-alanyl-D-alanine carboxypeptidase (penicillin-binding protein 5/6)
MKKFVVIFLIGVAVIAGAMFLNGYGESITLGEELRTEAPENEPDAPPENVIEKNSVEITAKNAYVINADSNFVLYKKKSGKRVAPASTAKMLTALTVLDYCAPDDKFTVGSEIGLIADDSSRAWLKKGDEMTVKQLLEALLLPSGNDAAYTLAVNAVRRITGDNGLSAEQAARSFVDAMNQKAKQIGAGSSNFVTPDGNDADGQYTTAFDLAQIAKACLNNDVLAEIMGSFKVSEKLANGREVDYTNTNELLNPDSSYYYFRAVGLKTGNSKKGGSCLVSAAVINGKTYICVIMGASDEGRFLDSVTIYNAIDPALSATPQDSAAKNESVETSERP